jgi:hypothetical protein
MGAAGKGTREGEAAVEDSRRRRGSCEMTAAAKTTPVDGCKRWLKHVTLQFNRVQPE